MQFKRPLRRRTAESVVPMINVVFLLLIFFMMSARIAPAPPFDLTLPSADQEAALSEEITLYLSREGALAVNGRTGEAAWAFLRANQGLRQAALRADAQLPAPVLAQTLRALAAAGLTQIDLAVQGP